MHNLCILIPKGGTANRQMEMDDATAAAAYVNVANGIITVLYDSSDVEEKRRNGVPQASDRSNLVPTKKAGKGGKAGKLGRCLGDAAVGSMRTSTCSTPS